MIGSTLPYLASNADLSTPSSPDQFQAGPREGENSTDSFDSALGNLTQGESGARGQKPGGTSSNQVALSENGNEKGGAPKTEVQNRGTDPGAAGPVSNAVSEISKNSPSATGAEKESQANSSSGISNWLQGLLALATGIANSGKGAGNLVVNPQKGQVPSTGSTSLPQVGTPQIISGAPPTDSTKTPLPVIAKPNAKKADLLSSKLPVENIPGQPAGFPPISAAHPAGLPANIASGAPDASQSSDPASMSSVNSELSSVREANLPDPVPQIGKIFHVLASGEGKMAVPNSLLASKNQKITPSALVFSTSLTTSPSLTSSSRASAHSYGCEMDIGADSALNPGMAALNLLKPLQTSGTTGNPTGMISTPGFQFPPETPLLFRTELFQAPSLSQLPETLQKALSDPEATVPRRVEIQLSSPAGAVVRLFITRSNGELRAQLSTQDPTTFQYLQQQIGFIRDNSYGMEVTWLPPQREGDNASDQGGENPRERRRNSRGEESRSKTTAANFSVGLGTVQGGGSMS